MEFNLTRQEKETILQLAKATLEQWITKRERPPLPKAEGNLAITTGAFVTLHKKGELRGCIGHMVGSEPLLKTIQEMAIASSTKDSRFPKVGPEELKDIDIEISVLSPMKRIKDVQEIEVGKHGILLGLGWNQGVLLPQVATEQRWDRETFIEQTCLKAGLPMDAWKNPEIVIEIFSAEVFGELSMQE